MAERFGRKVESRAWSRSCEMRGVACGACVEVTRRDATRRDDGKTPPRKTQGRKRGGEPAKRLDPIAPIGKEPTRFTGFLGQRVPVRDSFSRCCVAPRATKSVQAENPKLLRERAPLRGDQRARALLIRTMVSPDHTDDPESAEKQPQVRVLSDRRVPLDQCGRGVSAFLVTTLLFSRAAPPRAFPRPPRASHAR